MVDLVTLQSAAYAAQIVGVVGTLTAAFVGVRSYIGSNRRAEDARTRELDTRQAQLFMGIYEAMYSESFQESAIESLYMKINDINEYISMIEDPQRSKKFSIWGMWLEGQGVLVREGFVDVKLVAELTGGLIVMWWRKWGPFILSFRRMGDNSRHMVEAEYLVRRVVEYGVLHPELGIVSTDLKFSQ
ncbi:MAG: hypothetical protein ABSA11_14800 [Candidatus Bathyarchaeia archaeon]